jgi:2-deoxy-D-gluconate 3-dehydrogenase
MEKRFRGKVVVITGGSTGIGYAMARSFLDEGAYVVSLSRQSQDTQQVGGIHSFCLDIRNAPDVDRVFSLIGREYTAIDCLINNAGVYEDMHVGDDDFQAKWTQLLSTNLSGTANCIHSAVRYLRSRKAGCILNIGSAYSTYGHHKSAAYSASKAGVVGLSRAIAAELGRQGIRVNTLLPGWIDTNINAGLLGSARGNFIERVTPLGRFGIPGDVTGAAMFLCSDEAAFITGAELRIDGGYHISDRDYTH